LVEEDWTTNVMVIYIESNSNNITDQRILQEISYVEKKINPFVSDNESDDVIYILSISTVLKEINSSYREFVKPLSHNLVNNVQR
jgi:hypothetical protein